MSSYTVLLETSGFSTLFLQRIRLFAVEVYKCVNDFNPIFMSDTFTIKHVPYDMRDKSILVLPNFNNIRYGQKSFKYYASHVWNNLPANFKAAPSVTRFKNLVNKWNGPNCQCNLCDALF